MRAHRSDLEQGDDQAADPSNRPAPANHPAADPGPQTANGGEPGVPATEAESRLGRFRALDARPINRDGFAVEDPSLGLAAVSSPADPEPSLVLDDEGGVREMDGRRAEDFDLLD